MDVSINGSVVTSLSFSVTGAWDAWSTDTAVVILAAGLNSIRLTTTNSMGAPNMDKMNITTDGCIVTPTPPPTPTPKPALCPDCTPAPTPNDRLVLLPALPNDWATGNVTVMEISTNQQVSYTKSGDTITFSTRAGESYRIY